MGALSVRRGANMQRYATVAHVTTKVLFSLMRGLMFPILIKGKISIKSALCRGNYRYTGHTHLISLGYTIMFHRD